MQHQHYWEIDEIVVWSPDRFHIHFGCSCGARATSAHGIAGKGDEPYVIDKLIPNRGPEVHFLVRSEEKPPPQAG